MPILSRIEGPQDLKGLTHEQLAELAQDCRDVIIETITKTGGHLASNLGVVELTLALHRAFDSPKDRLVWDTSNQCYTHKLVTGRRDQFPSIRTPGGLSGFAEPSESAHDTLAAGHAGTGLSYGLGMSIAIQSEPDDPYVVVIVGDGALTSGPSYEALNNIVHVKPKRLIVILNDNGWSISENVGWLAHWRNRFELHPTYQKFIEAGHSFFKRLPKGDKAWELARKLKSSVEGLFFPNLIWDELGFHYVGPVNGHDFRELEEALARARDVSKDGTPGRHPRPDAQGTRLPAGRAEPLEVPPAGHADGRRRGRRARFTYSQVFAKTLITMMEKDPKIVAISAAMLEGTGLIEVKKKFPDRVFDVGHRRGARRHHGRRHGQGRLEAGRRDLLDVPAALLRPAHPRRRAPELRRDDLHRPRRPRRRRRQDAPGRLRHLLHARDPEHDGRAPKDENELQHMLFTAINSGRPFAVRYPRGLALGVELDPRAEDGPDRQGRDPPRGPGPDAPRLRLDGLGRASQAAEELEKRGISCGVANARFAKPLDMELLTRIVAATPRILTLEEHLEIGGFGAGVLEAFHDAGLPTEGLKVHAIPDQFIEHSPQLQQRHNLKLDVEGVVETVLAIFPDLGHAAGKGPASDGSRKEKKFAETVNW